MVVDRGGAIKSGAVAATAVFARSRFRALPFQVPVHVAFRSAFLGVAGSLPAVRIRDAHSTA